MLKFIIFIIIIIIIILENVCVSKSVFLFYFLQYYNISSVFAINTFSE